MHRGLRHSLLGEARSRLGLVLGIALVTLALVPVGASAEPLCTDTWTGPAEGEWQTAVSWSTGKVPTSVDVVCIGEGATVKVTESGQAGVVQGKGGVKISGTLEVVSVLEPSAIGSVQLSGGVLTGAGTVDVTGSLSVTGGKMTGSGSTVVSSGASATLAISSFFELYRVLNNEGTLTFSEGTIYEYEGAQIKNSGTFKANSEASSGQFRVGSGTPSIVNTGLFEKTAGAGETSINGPSFESSGTLNGASGKLGFPTGSVAFSTGSVVNGAIALRGAAVTGGSFNASAATVTFTSGGSLTLTSGSTATIGTFVMQRGSLVTGPGVLDVSTTFTSEGGKMTGTGSTVILPGASGTMGNGESIFEIWERTLLNEGVILSKEGTIFMDEGAHFENVGTFKANAENPSFDQFDEGGFGHGYILNTGLFEKTEGTGKTIVKPFIENFGAIEEHTGIIEFKHPVARGESTLYGEENPSAANQEVPECGEGVNCATGNLSKSQTDFAVGGRGVGLDLTRTYNSQAAANAVIGAFGYGWSSSFDDHLVVEGSGKKAILYQAKGSRLSK